jgi:hypothetical protein
LFISRLFIIMAKDGEVAPSFQPLLGMSPLIFLEPYGGEVADPMIEALFAFARLGPYRGNSNHMASTVGAIGAGVYGPLNQVGHGCGGTAIESYEALQHAAACLSEKGRPAAFK